MSSVRKRIGTCVITALLLQCTIAPLAAAQDYRMPIDTDPRVMFYVSKAFGESRELRKAPKMGLRLERHIDSTAGRLQLDLDLDRQPVRSMSYVDLRWTKGFGESVRVLGVPLHRSQLQLDALSEMALGYEEGSTSEASSALSSGESWTDFRTWILAFAVSAAVLCAFGELICEDDGRSSPRSTDTGNDTPGT